MECESPQLIVWIGPDVPNNICPPIPVTFHGEASELSPYHDDWDVIRQVDHLSSIKIGRFPTSRDMVDPLFYVKSQLYAEEIIRKRRSAQSFDGKSVMPKSSFYSILTKLIPELGSEVWSIFSNPPRIHMALFVHRVDGMIPGLYVLVRDSEQVDIIKKDWSPNNFKFEWRAMDDTPSGLNLFLCVQEDVTMLANRLSCDQDIASDSCFTVAMIGNLTQAVDSFGPFSYRELHWEAGYIGQILYLEAEALGFRGTGIGCFYDDPILLTLGCNSNYQDFYHFTIGMPKVDRRIAKTI